MSASKIHIGLSSSTDQSLWASFWLASVLCFSNYLFQSSAGILPYLSLIQRAIHKTFDDVESPGHFSVYFMCFMIEGKCWDLSIGLWKGMDMVIGSTLHSLSLTCEMCSCIPCSATHISWGCMWSCCSTLECAFWSPCYTLAVIKLTLLPFCYHFPLEIGNPASLFQ